MFSRGRLAPNKAPRGLLDGPGRKISIAIRYAASASFVSVVSPDCDGMVSINSSAFDEPALTRWL